MTTLSEILNPTKLLTMMAEKRINVQYHPDLPLRIYNYSNAAQYAGRWTHEERVCRGLIIDEDDNVIARGPSKFFNYGQVGGPDVELDDKVWVSRKEDGSLGIGWYYDGIYGVATRGSFTSDQAIKATEMLTSSDRANIKVGSTRHNRTQIFEIVYPENRIVLDYKGLSKNIRLGFVGNDTGVIYGRNLGVLIGEGFNFEYEMTFAEAVALPIPDDEEGYVIDVFKDGDIAGHIKLKGENYLRLHGAIFGLSERKIWEVMASDTPIDEFIAGLPDELHAWAERVYTRLNSEIAYHSIVISRAFNETRAHFGMDPEEVDRGIVARYWKEKYPEYTSPLFSVLDHRHPAMFDWIHKRLRPEHKLFRTNSEDVN